MNTGNKAFDSYKLLSQRDALIALDDSQLKDLLSNASRQNVRAMFEFSLTDIKGAFDYMGIDIGEGAKGLGDKRKKATFIKMAIQSLSVFHFDNIDKAIDKLSYALGKQNNSLDPDEQEVYETVTKAIEEKQNQPTLETVKTVEPKVETKKVTKEKAKIEKNLKLNSQAPIVRWESDFMGQVCIGIESREFWVQDPYTNPVVNLVTSNGMTILSAWESTKENPFMRAAVREFHETLAKREDQSLIENRLITIAIHLSSSKKRVDWYAQSAESLVLTDGKKMEPKLAVITSECLQSTTDFELSKGSAYYKAQYYARTYPDKYNYVEGFAIARGRLFHHAWVQFKPDGKAIDVAFYDTEQFFGVVLDITWVTKVIASRLKDDSISPRYTQSIIEGNFLDDFKFLKSGLTETAIAW